MINRVELVSKHGLMAVSMKVIMLMAKKKAMESSTGVMVMFSKASFLITGYKVKAPTSGLTKESMLENGKIIR